MSQWGGNVLIIFDVNGYGETVTAPHIRRPQLSTDVLRKLLRSLNLARHGVADPPMVPEGEIHLVVNGGRQNNAVFSKMYGVGPGVRGRRPDPGTGATVCRQTTLLFNETSVKTRKVRLAKGRLAVVKCTQGLLTWYNTNTSIPSRPHKFFPETTNAGDTYGPIALEAWQKLPFLTVADKKLFWGKRLMSFETKYTHTHAIGEYELMHVRACSGGLEFNFCHFGWQFEAWIAICLPQACDFNLKSTQTY